MSDEDIANLILYVLIFIVGMVAGAHITTLLWLRSLRKVEKTVLTELNTARHDTPEPRTGAEQYFADRMKDPNYQQAYEDTRQGETMF